MSSTLLAASTRLTGSTLPSAVLATSAELVGFVNDVVIGCDNTS